MGVFVDEGSGRVRSGWVVVVFAGVAALVYAPLSTALGLLGLAGGPLALSNLNLAFHTSVMLVASSVATAVCRLAFRADAGLARDRAGKDLVVGAALGTGLVALAVLVPVAAGAGTLAPSAASVSALAVAGLQQMLILAPTSIGEELLLRGVVLRQLARGVGGLPAIVATGAVFGLMHLVNPSASAVAAANVALVGVWFGLLALYWSLWRAIAVHVAWNWNEGFVFGQPVSGIEPGASLFGGSVFEGTEGFFSGGAFGPEASGLTTVLLALACLLTWWRAPKNLDSPPQLPWKPPT